MAPVVTVWNRVLVEKPAAARLLKTFASLCWDSKANYQARKSLTQLIPILGESDEPSSQTNTLFLANPCSFCPLIYAEVCQVIPSLSNFPATML
jgi:hypothetical protein